MNQMKQKLQTEQNSNYHKLILVFYLSISGIRSEDIDEFMHKVSERIIPNIDAEVIILPVDGATRVECINPQYITDSDLIKKHERLIAELHEHLNYQIKELKEKKNE